jgi:hypothetical protein
MILIIAGSFAAGALSTLAILFLVEYRQQQKFKNKLQPSKRRKNEKFTSRS